jgi:hypothetical protein
MQVQNAAIAQKGERSPWTIAVFDVVPRHKHSKASTLVRQIKKVILRFGLIWGVHMTFKVGDRLGLKICATIRDDQLAPAAVAAALLALRTKSYLVDSVKVSD